MQNRLAFNLPINSVSFGQVSILILRTLFEKGQPSPSPISLFPHGGADKVNISAYDIPDEVKKWMSESVNNTDSTHSRDWPIFKLWHIFGSLESFSKKQVLLTFYELDEPTPLEINVINNNTTFVTNSYTQSVINAAGGRCGLIPLAFDSYTFFPTGKQYFFDGRITFNLCGKLEKRKHHAKAIRAWIKRFGNNKKYSLQCAVYNHFIQPQANQQAIMAILGGNKPFNVSFMPHMNENHTYNDFLNSGDIILGASGAEGWGLPEFHSVAIGKHGVIMNAHGYKEWATADNACLFEPAEKEDAYDNMFFRKGQAINQGRIFGFNEDAFIHQCEEAVKRFEANPVNEAGKQLQSRFSKELLLSNVLAAIESV